MLLFSFNGLTKIYYFVIAQYITGNPRFCQGQKIIYIIGCIQAVLNAARATPAACTGFGPS
jgi:hypothetical protein